MASTGRKRNVHAALSALVGILQGLIGEKRRQEDRGLKERQIESEESHRWAQLQRDLQRDYDTKQYREARTKSTQDEAKATQKRHEENLAERRRQFEAGAPGREALTRKNIADAEKAEADTEVAKRFGRLMGGDEESTPQQPAPEPAPAAPAPAKGSDPFGKAFGMMKQRPGTRMPTPQQPQQPLGSLTPGDVQFAGLPNMAANTQDAQIAADVYRAYQIVMGQEPYHPVQVAKAYVFLNQYANMPLPAWVQQMLMQQGSIGPNGLTPSPMMQPRQPAMSGPDMGR